MTYVYLFAYLFIPMYIYLSVCNALPNANDTSESSQGIKASYSYGIIVGIPN